MSRIITCLWFGREAEAAARLYTSLVPNASVDGVHRAPTDYPGGKAGDVLTVRFTLDGAQFLGLNGGEPAVYGTAASIIVEVDDQVELDRLWEGLLADGGKPMACGWLTDRFGVPWQVTPRRLLELTTSPDREVAARVFQAMMGMIKIDLAALEAAARG